MGDWLWIGYLGVLATVAIAYLLQGKYNTKVMLFDLLISIVTWFGLFGYVTEREFGAPLLWKAVFVVGALWDTVFTLFLYRDEEVEELPLAARAVGLIVIVPLYYGLYQYAFS